MQDNCQQEFAAEPFNVAISGTDNLALLKNVAFTTVGMPYHPSNGSNYLGNITLFDYIKIAIQQTGLSDLPLRIYSNIFENTTTDRSTDATAEMFQETIMHTGRYLNSDGTWKDLYTILNDLGSAFNFQIFQDDGCWQITRLQEASQVSGNAIPGVEHNLITGTKKAITLNANVSIVYQSIQALDGADQVSRIQRPFKYVKETFNYSQPASFIANSDLQMPSDATPFASNTVGNIRYDKYNLQTYFPSWRYRNGDTSYLQVEYDILQNREIDRYIYTPGHAGMTSGIEFNPIAVSAGDSLDFTLQFKMLNNDNNTLRFWVRFVIIQDNGYKRDLLDNIGDPFGTYWAAAQNAIYWDDGFGIYYEIPASNVKTNYTTWSFSAINSNTKPPIKFIGDGILLVEVFGTNGTNTSNRQDAVWKDISLTINNYIGESTLVTGQYHNNEQFPLIKNNYDEEVQIDDSPRNSIAGTLFTDKLTNFDYTDPDRGNTQTELGDIYFTRTKNWHRFTNAETLRLGQIMVIERLNQSWRPQNLLRRARTIIEGSFLGLKDINNNFVGLQCLFTVDSLPGVWFVLGSMQEINWVENTYKAVLNELYAENDTAPVSTYNFAYIYKTS